MTERGNLLHMRSDAFPAIDMERLSELSVSIGNIPLKVEDSVAAVIIADNEIIGFAAAQQAWHAAGSWVREDMRRKGITHLLRARLERQLTQRGACHYFSIPNTEFERELFKKYGPVDERIVQVKRL